MVAEAQRSRAPIQAVADRVSGWFVPLVVAIAVVTFVIWNIVGSEPRFGHALLNAIAVLIIACPCALGLATPMSIMVGTGRGARAGVLIKDAEALQMLERVDTLVIDKTGTLTEGHPRLTAIEPANGYDSAAVLAAAATVEAKSEHPLAQAIVTAARADGTTVPTVSDFASQTELGVSGIVNGREIAVGNADQMRRIGADPTTLDAIADRHRGEGAGVMFVAIDNRLAGLLAYLIPSNRQLARRSMRYVRMAYESSC